MEKEQHCTDPEAAVSCCWGPRAGAEAGKPEDGPEDGQRLGKELELPPQGGVVSRL